MTVVHPSSRKTFAAVLRVVDGTSLWQSGKSKKAQVKANPRLPDVIDGASAEHV